MAKKSGPVAGWFKIEDGSELEVAVTIPSDTPGAFSVVGLRASDEARLPDWKPGDLRPGPATMTLSSPRVYSVILLFTFTGQQRSTAEVAARVVRPDGDTHGDPYEDSVSGKGGATKAITLGASTLKTNNL